MVKEDSIAELVKLLKEKDSKPKTIETVVVEKKEMPFSLPRWIKSKLGRKDYAGYCLVVFLRRNREMEMKYLPTSNELIRVEDKYYDARTDCFFTYGKQRVPVLVLPEWSLRPIGTAEYQEAVAQGVCTDGEDVIIKAHERMENEKLKKKIDSKIIIIGLIILVIGGIAFTQFK